MTIYMNNNLTATTSIQIKASKSTVWEALTTPELIKQYFFGTEAVSDWKKGSSLHFRGVWEGKAYEDKGFIIESETGKLLKYSYWSSFSGTPDVPENYSLVTYKLQEAQGITTVTVMQDGLATEEARGHSEKNWDMVLSGMKKMVENT